MPSACMCAASHSASAASRFARASLYCAEAGLNATRQTIINNYATWNDILDPNATSPSWYGEGIEGEAGDDDDNDDWVVTIYDNDDEFPTPDPARDNDLRIFVKSECRMFSDQPRSVVELVRYDTMPSDYEGKCKGAQCANDMTP